MGNTVTNKNVVTNSNILEVFLTESSNNVLIEKKSLLIGDNIVSIPNYIDTIKFLKKQSNNTNELKIFSHLKFLSFIHSNVKKIICESVYQPYINIINLLCDNLPLHIEHIELDILANKTEIFPYLNNLPTSLKYLKINNLNYVPENNNNFSYDFIFEENDILNNNDVLLKVNIKLPFECKILLPNDKSYDDVNKIFFKLKYNSKNINYNNNMFNNIKYKKINNNNINMNYINKNNTYENYTNDNNIHINNINYNNTYENYNIKKKSYSKDFYYTNYINN